MAVTLEQTHWIQIRMMTESVMAQMLYIQFALPVRIRLRLAMAAHRHWWV